MIQKKKKKSLYKSLSAHTEEKDATWYEKEKEKLLYFYNNKEIELKQCNLRKNIGSNVLKKWI